MYMIYFIYNQAHWICSICTRRKNNRSIRKNEEKKHGCMSSKVNIKIVSRNIINRSQLRKIICSTYSNSIQYESNSKLFHQFFRILIRNSCGIRTLIKHQNFILKGSLNIWFEPYLINKWIDQINECILDLIHVHFVLLF